MNENESLVRAFVSHSHKYCHDHDMQYTINFTLFQGHETRAKIPLTQADYINNGEQFFESNAYNYLVFL